MHQLAWAALALVLALNEFAPISAARSGAIAALLVAMAAALVALAPFKETCRCGAAASRGPGQPSQRGVPVCRRGHCIGSVAPPARHRPPEGSRRRGAASRPDLTG
jgi:hypothetical protein